MIFPKSGETMSQHEVNTSIKKLHSEQLRHMLNEKTH